MSEFTMIQNVSVLFVEIEDCEVRADIVGGTTSAFGSVVWQFGDLDEATTHARTLEVWATDGRPVTYFERNGVVALVDEQQLLSEAYTAA